MTRRSYTAWLPVHSTHPDDVLGAWPPPPRWLLAERPTRGSQCQPGVSAGIRSGRRVRDCGLVKSEAIDVDCAPASCGEALRMDSSAPAPPCIILCGRAGGGTARYVGRRRVCSQHAGCRVCRRVCGMLRALRGSRTRALGGLCGTQPGVGTLRALSYGAGLKIFNDERLTIIQYVYARGATLLPASSHTYLCRHAMRMDWPLNSRCATQKQQNGVPPNRHPRHHATRHLMACSVATMIPQSAKAAP